MLSCIVGVKSINSFDYEESKLREWSNKEMLKCPECGERVIYCKGDYKIPYFKHEAGSECEGCAFSEPMTNEHIEGIAVLYNRLKEIEGVENLEVEKYITNTRQRPDIYFEYKDDRYCIEFQCSPISTEYNKRHELYELEGINDIWILGTQKYNFDIDGSVDGSILFKEKKVKSIEDEIDRGKLPLLYLKNNTIFKMNKKGFGAVIRDEHKNFNKISPLKKTFSCILDKYNINIINLDDIICKENPNIDDIHRITKETIIKCENLISELNNNLKTKYIFRYNISVDRFPLYEIDADYYIKEFYDVGFNNIENVCEKIKNDFNLKTCITKYLSFLEDKYSDCNFRHSKHSNKIDICIGYPWVVIYSTGSINTLEELENVKTELINIENIITNYKINKEMKEKERLRLISIKENLKKQHGIRQDKNKYKFIEDLSLSLKNNLINYNVSCYTGYSRNGYGSYKYGIKIHSKITGKEVYSKDRISDGFNGLEIIKEIRKNIYKYKMEFNGFEESLMMLKNRCRELEKLVNKLNIRTSYESKVFKLRIELYGKCEYLEIDLNKKEIVTTDNIYDFNKENLIEVFNGIIHNEIRRLRYGSI